jgi:nucleoside-diphosphate-sugar epimerase
MLARLARLLPVLPLIGSGHTRLQPVYVDDVVEAIADMLVDLNLKEPALGVVVLGRPGDYREIILS